MAKKIKADIAASVLARLLAYAKNKTGILTLFSGSMRRNVFFIAFRCPNGATTLY